MSITDHDERRILGASLLTLALSAAALAIGLGIIAQVHMAGAANLCGSPAQHCVACYGALVSLAASLVTGCAAMSFFAPPAGAPAESGPKMNTIQS